MTERQKEVLTFISAFTAENGFAPSYREIGTSLNITPNAVRSKLQALQAKGCITVPAGRQRAIALTAEGKAACSAS